MFRPFLYSARLFDETVKSVNVLACLAVCEYAATIITQQDSRHICVTGYRFDNNEMFIVPVKGRGDGADGS